MTPFRFPQPVCNSMSLVASWNREFRKRPTDDETQCDASLVHSLHVVAYPRDCVWDTGIDPQCAEKDPKVAQRGIAGSNQDGKAGDSDKGGTDIEDSSFAGAVGSPTDQHGQHTGCYVRWN